MSVLLTCVLSVVSEVNNESLGRLFFFGDNRHKVKLISIVSARIVPTISFPVKTGWEGPLNLEEMKKKIRKKNHLVLFKHSLSNHAKISLGKINERIQERVHKD